jgi:hypothetical protein
MTTKKKTKKEKKENTVLQNHSNPKTLNQLYVKEGKSADAKEDYKNASWLKKQISAGKRVFVISKQ